MAVLYNSQKEKKTNNRCQMLNKLNVAVSIIYIYVTGSPIVFIGELVHVF